MEGPYKELSEKELLYCEAYFTNNFNKTSAAITSTGCKKENARTVGYEMYSRPHVKAYIQDYLRLNTLDGDETIKLVSRIAQSDIKDYYKPVKVKKLKNVEEPLERIIEDLKVQIEIKQEFAALKGWESERNDAYTEMEINPLQDEILMLELQLKRNPLATKIVTMECLEDEMQLDINSLIADKERGVIKKVEYGKDGLKVEMYAADAAHDKLLKVHGKYEKDNERVVKITSSVTPEEAKAIAAALEDKY